ncbi:hypothetical protein KPH14_012149 [Odynerus spinipes]|uniref:Disks large-associated protein 5 n=1 Tax=Odynerus spinipes TaxID=1348599 RepID=A0AAD9VLY7_9HYME|nr:hypothetical protein KPH14_012149 [Odynerus spinipes]
MASYQDQYKAKNGFGDVKNNRAFRAKLREIKRKEQRVENFAKNRELEIVTDGTTNTGDKDNRLYKLLKWKAERDRHKKIEQVKKKPAFKVGVVHHSYYSPASKGPVTLSATKQCFHGRKQKTHPATPPKRITKATEKRLIQKSIVSKEVLPKQNVKKKQELLIEKKKEKDVVKNQSKSFAPDNYKFTAPSGLKSIPLFGRVAVLHTPVKPTSSVETINKAVVSSQQKSKSIDNDASDSVESITLQLSPDECELTFDWFTKTQLLRTSTPSNNKEAHISPSKTLPETTTKNETPRNVNSNETKMLAVLRNDSNTSTKTNSLKDPALLSPYIVSSRGKSNAMKEQRIRRGIGHSSSEHIPTKETVMETLNISIEEEERTAQYFTFLLNKETDRLNELCQKWTEIQSEPNITEDDQYRINQAIGQTHLLINKKFERFRGLVLDCETGKGEMLVTCRDLQGFWDMMYMEIKNCDSRFEALEKLRSNGWKEEEIAVAKVIPKKKVGPKKKIVPKKSSVHDFILAAKKKMKNNTKNLETSEDHTNDSINKLSTSINNIDIEQNKSQILRKSDNRQSESVNSKNRLSISNKKTSSRQSLLQKTTLSESHKTVASSVAIMKISQMCKTPKIELDDSISYINCKQTPGKSILKRTDDSTGKKTQGNTSCTKSIQKVNFDDHVALQEVPVDEEIQNKLDLAARLARIDNYDLDAAYKNYNITAAEKLNFDDSSFLESECNLQGSTKLHLSDITDEKDNALLNYSTQPVENISSKNEDISLDIPPKKSIQNETNTKILRNRVIVTNNSTRTSTRRKSIKDLVDEDKGHQKENNTPMKLKKGSQRIYDDKDEDHHKENNTPMKLKRGSHKMSNKFKAEPITKKEPLNATPVNVRKDLRRSSRKSVRFNAEECSACTEHKPVHPMTPHARRSKGNMSLSFLQNVDTVVQPLSPDADLISWDSPRIPARVRRSSRSSTKHCL